MLLLGAGGALECTGGGYTCTRLLMLHPSTFLLDSAARKREKVRSVTCRPGRAPAYRQPKADAVMQRTRSTIVKQMRLTYGYPFADEERYVRVKRRLGGCQLAADLSS